VSKMKKPSGSPLAEGNKKGGTTVRGGGKNKPKKVSEKAKKGQGGKHLVVGDRNCRGVGEAVQNKK